MTTQVYMEFARHWHESKTLNEVIAKTGQTKSAAKSLACRMRKLGWQLKKFNSKVGKPA